MSIAKRIWTALVALKDGLVLIAMLLFFWALYMALSSSEGPSPFHGGALVIDLDGVLVEQPEELDPLSLIQGGGPSFAQYRGRDVIRALNLAAKDDDINSVVLNLDGFMGGGQVLVQDVASALAKVKAAKKPIYAYSSGYFDDSYILAAQANEVWLDPLGAVLFQGPGGNNLYLNGLLDRFGQGKISPMKQRQQIRLWLMTFGVIGRRRSKPQDQVLTSMPLRAIPLLLLRVRD
jgi:protease IV